ncbi:UNVERIFIED_CONTAM: nupl2 [Trichonephila clavipes]
MTVCRYFLQGNCRFGDRCRFEHTDPHSSYYESTPRRNDYNRYDNRSYNYNSRGRNDYSYDGRRNDYSYDQSQTSYVDQQYNRRYYPPESNQYRSSYTNSDNYNTQARYGSRTQGNSYQTNYYPNKNEWVSDDYRRQVEQKRNTELFPNSNIPKSKISFSFKDQDAQSNKDHSTDLYTSDKTLVYVELIKEDIKAWELGSQWPFTCYCPIQEKSNFPGFTDLSPEELRYEAYKARESNTYDSYIESMNKVLQNIKLRRDQLKEPSVQMISIIEKLRNGQNLDAESSVDGILPFSKSNKSVLEDMVAQESSIQKSASSFSFKTTLDNYNVSKTSASNFSFKLPPDTEVKQSSQTAGGSDIYTSLEKLSDQDKEQFSASTFTLGKIPTMPPPQALCF